MYSELIRTNQDYNILVIAKLGIALADNDDKALTTAINDLNTVLRSIVEKTPERMEVLIIEIYQTVFKIYADLNRSADDGLLDICNRILSDVETEYPIKTIFETYTHFGAYVDNCEKEELATLYEMATEVNGTVLSYVICRKLLNIVMSSVRFLDHVDLTKKLIKALESCSAKVKEASFGLGGDLFFAVKK